MLELYSIPDDANLPETPGEVGLELIGALGLRDWEAIRQALGNEVLPFFDDSRMLNEEVTQLLRMTDSRVAVLEATPGYRNPPLREWRRFLDVAVERGVGIAVYAD